MAGMLSRLKHVWNAFTNENVIGPTDASYSGSISYSRPDRIRYSYSNERSIIASIYTRLSVDISSVDIRHVRLDENGRYQNDMVSSLNDCLSIEANVDQSASHLIQDIAHTMFEKGVVAVVPVDTTVDPTISGAFDVQTLRVGEIVGWSPSEVSVRLYNEKKAYREEIWLDKKFIAIVENPFYSIMNETNSTLQRLIRKINMLDVIDEQTSSGKLDLIIQLPYVVKSEQKRLQAEQRRKDIEFQLKGSKYGIAYTDGTEKITQLNRPAENNLMEQIEYLVNMLYSQLGLTDSIMNGTADEATMTNYYARTIHPILVAITQAMKRSFLTKKARTQGQSIEFYRDPFRLLPLSKIAEIADVFRRDEIFTGNDVRTAIGVKPSKDPKADLLQNSNMPASTAPSGLRTPLAIGTGGDSQNGS